MHNNLHQKPPCFLDYVAQNRLSNEGLGAPTKGSAKRKVNMKKPILSVAVIAVVAVLCASSAQARVRVPDAGSTSLLLGPVVIGLAAVRRFLRR